ncbi:MAG TPA: zinc-dependent peptidase [Steroidobacteraceae bacterium]|nr:zinc-dependent peptidase [Steroidobacteraceae bacterium]HQX47623.1 zinc-dependent peptidase [Steroidobacteraceae bacterium]HQX78333.1 zinc-dependent peptidase [Steroidobacteraceae bacterium]HQZ80781.1 zinc-dependent peptidase [Steroidobacteraceae bacterium]
MTALPVLGGLVAFGILVAVWRVRAARRLNRTLREPFPPAWRALLARVRLYGSLPPTERERVELAARRLLHRVNFIGCGGLSVTDEMRLIVATQAAFLVAHRDPRAYDALYSVLLYPAEFVVEDRDEDEYGLVTEGSRALSGQAIDLSRIVLSWEDIEAGLASEGGYNVVLHEFAHHLDHLSDGALTDGGSLAPAADRWHAALQAAYEELCDAVDRGEDTLIDPYGAEDLGEFFATATEVFFERAGEFRTAHPRLHAQLREFYGVDPADWSGDR